ncbi:MAG: 1,5-anhydro-D-fructose reductase [Planctomycetes bacterium ADurb.Bin412]|nr:MAG: 1,5-anhydro-D-fructose reductase [Planctomycetes bacterium ADurb.Bin412]
MTDVKTNQGMNRRTFLRSTAAAGAGLMFSPLAKGQTAVAAKPDQINVALLGAGAQGQVLLDACLNMGENSGLCFKAVCDIWESWNLKRVSGQLSRQKELGHVGTPYTNYQEMLDKEKDLDALIVATPDFWHAEHAIAGMKAGLHVYCEKEMSNTLENARKMVETAKATGKLLQIGHQRRSNPRYIFCYEKLIQEAKILGRITTINGQWNRSRAACEDLAWAKNAELDEATLNTYGFESMKQFRNWRWYKGLGGGPIVDLGSHQIDIYSWFLNAQPRSVMASGGVDYWTDHQWYDNVIALYEYQTQEGVVRASYQTLTTNSSNGYFETFMGDQGTLMTSEEGSRNAVYREGYVPEELWNPWENKRYIKKENGIAQAEPSKSVLDVRSSPKPPKYNLLVDMDQPFHQPHLQNFFDSIRGKAKLNCPGEIGYETAVAVLKVNEAVEAARRLDFKPEDFLV